ncbi:MAG: NAD(+) synthase [Candidatus Fermentibacteraceae bacterium]|nr:NAD(+) synthase [Candidatus Fermentibacteraceae bacterium]
MDSRTDYGRLAGDIRRWIRDRVAEASVSGLVVGISGGLDSAVAAALGAGAVGNRNVMGLLMPCGSSREDTEDGARVCEHLDILSRIIELSPVLEEFLEAGGMKDSTELNRANIKARLRMAMLYAHSGGRLVLGTSNYSEISVGYWTKWGDGASDLLPIGRLYKEEVRELAKALGLPRWVIERVPSAGLWPGQSDEKEMGVTYRQIYDYFTGGELPEMTASRIEDMVRATQHKRRPIPYFDAREWMEENG